MRNGEDKSRAFAKELRASMTKAEAALWKRLQEANRHGYHFRRQHPVGPFIADFAHVKGSLIVEVDGATHGNIDEIARDVRRDAYLEARGWRVIRIANVDIYSDLDAVVEAVLSQLPPPARDKSRATSPASQGRIRGRIL